MRVRFCARGFDSTLRFVSLSWNVIINLHLIVSLPSSHFSHTNTHMHARTQGSRKGKEWKAASELVRQFMCAIRGSKGHEYYVGQGGTSVCKINCQKNPKKQTRASPVSQNHEKNIPRQKQSVGEMFTARDKMESATMAAIQRLSQFSGRLPKGRARWKLDVDYGEQPPFPHHSCTLNSISCWIPSHSTRLILLSINLSLTHPVFV